MINSYQIEEDIEKFCFAVLSSSCSFLVSDFSG